MNDPDSSPSVSAASDTGNYRIVVPAVVAAYLGCDLAVGGIFELGPQHEELLALLVGIYVAQINLIAIWAALALGRVIVRWPWAWFLAALMWFAMILGNRFYLFRMQYSSRFDRSDALTLGVVLLFGVITAQVPLWIARRWKWRLVLGTSDAIGAASDERQFSLRQLLLSMVLLSVALGLGRWILPPGRVAIDLDDELLFILPVIAIVNMLVVLPCIWGAFFEWRLLPVLAVVWFMYALVVTAIEIGVLVAFLGPAGDDIFAMFLLFNLAQCLAVAGTLMVLRVAGVRFIRQGGPSERDADTTTVEAEVVASGQQAEST
jgi:hypothetical protein